MNVSRCIKQNSKDSPGKLYLKIENVSRLVGQNVISPKFASVIIEYLIRQDLIRQEVGGFVTDTIEHSIKKNKKDAWLSVNYAHKQTNYL